MWFDCLATLWPRLTSCFDLWQLCFLGLPLVARWYDFARSYAARLCVIHAAHCGPAFSRYIISFIAVAGVRFDGRFVTLFGG
jgi:hypothetical protein